MARSPGPLLRLVHSLERKRPGLAFDLQLRATPCVDGVVGSPTDIRTIEISDHAPRVLVVGGGDRVDLSVQAGLLPRHLAVTAVPGLEGVEIRIATLHPDRTIEHAGRVVGGVQARDHVTVDFEGVRLEASAALALPPAEGTAPPPLRTFGASEQFAFFAESPHRQLGDVVSSIGGPVGGGHAIPALVADMGSSESLGSLVLRSRDGLHELQPTPTELRRGLLVGRSRRCVLGRGFDENDGLSRLHALVVMLNDGVYAFDLASRYGLRDVARPTRLVTSSRLDNGIGCLVYGAGHLIFEP